MPQIVQINDALRAVPGYAPFDPDDLWWDLEVLANGRWVRVQSGPVSSNLWWDLGVELPR